MQTLNLNVSQSVSEPLMATALSDNREVELLEKKAVSSKPKSDLSESAVVSAGDESDSVTEDESSDVQAWPEALSQAKPGPEKPRPSQAKALLRPWLRAWLEILKAQAKPSGPGLFIE